MKTTKKINSEFDEIPIALFSLLSSNEFKLINYLINVANSTNNSTVSVSYSQLMKDCNITCNKTIKRTIDSLITLNLLSRKSGNVTTNNSYTINFDYINELNSKTIDIPIEEQISINQIINKMEKNSKDLQIARQSSLKLAETTLSWKVKNNYSVHEMLKLSEIITEYVINGTTDDVINKAKIFDKYINEKMEKIKNNSTNK